MKSIFLFIVTAIVEILGCYLPYLWIKEHRSILLLIPTAFLLMLFVWLLTLHPTASGRVYAAYGGIYIVVAILWLWLVDKVTPTTTDILGALICLLGSAIIIFGTFFKK